MLMASTLPVFQNLTVVKRPIRGLSCLICHTGYDLPAVGEEDEEASGLLADVSFCGSV